jgi:hypothetical protein
MQQGDAQDHLVHANGDQNVKARRQARHTQLQPGLSRYAARRQHCDGTRRQQRLINVSTRKFGRAVRLPEGDVLAGDGAGLSKSTTSRRFVALSAERMKEWMACDLSRLDLLAIQIDGIHIAEDLMLLAAIGVDGLGGKHPLAVIEGAAEKAAVAQALLDNLEERGLDPKVCRLFIIATGPRR